MKALKAFGVHDLRVADLPEPEAGPGEVKVAVRRAVAMRDETLKTVIVMP